MCCSPWGHKESDTTEQLDNNNKYSSDSVHLSGGFLGGSAVKNPPANAGDMGLILGSGKSPRERHGKPLQYSCLENPLDRGALQATIHVVTRVRHHLATKPTQRKLTAMFIIFIISDSLYRCMTEWRNMRMNE